MFTLGENIKKLRRAKELTQESLADMLHITPQAVSRWETGLTSPDAALLPKLAYIFGCTTDELLGVSHFNREEKFQEYRDKAHELGTKGEGTAVVDLWRHALEEMPGDCTVMAELATHLRFIADSRTEEGLAMFREAKALYETVLERADDPDLIHRTRSFLPTVYKYLGEQEKAQAVTELLPRLWTSREIAKREIAADETERLHAELEVLGHALMMAKWAFDYLETHVLTDDERGELMKKHEAIERLLYDGDEREMPDDLRLRYAKWLSAHGETEEALRRLRTAAEIAKWKDDIDYNNGGYCRTVGALPFRYNGEITNGCVSATPFTYCGDVKEELADKAYNPIRDTAEFREIEAMLG